MNDKIKKLIEISKENPELEIVCATHYEVVGEDWGYWHSVIKKIEVDYTWIIDDRWIIGEDSILEKIDEDVYYDDNLKILSDKDSKKIVNERFKQKILDGEIKKQIIIYIELP